MVSRSLETGLVGRSRSIPNEIIVRRALGFRRKQWSSSNGELRRGLKNHGDSRSHDPSPEPPKDIRESFL